MVRALRSSLMRFARVWCILRSYFSLLHYCRRSCIFLSRIPLFSLSSFPFFFLFSNHQLEKDWFNLWTNWHSWCGRSIDITVNRFRILLIRIPIRRIALIPFCRRNCRSNVRIMCRVSGFLIRRRPFLRRYFRHGQGNTILIRYSRGRRGRKNIPASLCLRSWHKSGAYTGLTFWKLTPPLTGIVH